MALMTAPLGRRDNFPYQRLGDREIRLVIVKKHTHWPRANSLSCSIIHIDIDRQATSTPYTALSYAWGDGQDATSLPLRDEATGKSGDITVTSSLIAALQTILEPGKRHALWIDQICINQSNTVEKGQQVQLMRWIYERATTVHIWLGPASEGSDEAIAYLRTSDEISLLRDFADRSRARFTVQIEKSVEGLLSRAYWARTWAVQEATALAPRDTIVSCGTSSVYLKHIFGWNNTTNTVMLNRGGFVNGTDWTFAVEISVVHRFAAGREKPTIILHKLVREIRDLTASDPRDKIYSMLNFATDVLPAEIEPDYNKSVRQAYTEYVLWFISKYRCLDILGDCHPSLTDEEAPSWVPDWNKKVSMYSFPKTSDENDPSSDALFRASGVYLHDISVRQPFDVNARLLVLSGARISKLDVVRSRKGVQGHTWAAYERWQPLNGGTICPLNSAPMHEVFRRTIYQDVFTRDYDKYTRGNDLALPWETKSTTSDSELTQITEIVMLVKRSEIRRCLFYTEPCEDSSQGLLGLGPDTARSGDELWILKGGKTPFILRQKAMTIPSTNLGTGKPIALPVDAGMPTYELVGEAFVLGLMDGEIIDMLGEAPKRQRPPPLANMDKDWRTIGLI